MLVVMMVLVVMRILMGGYGGDGDGSDDDSVCFRVTFAGVHLGEQQEGVGPGRLRDLRMETHRVVIRGLEDGQEEEAEEEEEEQEERWEEEG